MAAKLNQSTKTILLPSHHYAISITTKKTEI